ncbi:bifunctional metallophosphatase/5'-nucleotidase [Halobacillus locisalis]|uniref:Bifunctional metallophosphatase/5'-nucleotidase n=1 Tax=Halobacillus locisalis TaxID=220753 RepID=A0A838CXI8_9BACI|nr:bifunctional UDP-sugar hydrolase/5'-nucleotidase [Halobacillus locisalis]MBA2176641.1 bifunctional metallophosphatase/5'-nucleotidase [Halobacillus locisalis]
MKLTILHTNDIHSNYENFAKAVTVIKQHKQEQTLLLEGGDFADFKSIELQGTRGLAAIEMLEHVGYDALTIGNNETFNGVDTLQHMASQSRVPFIGNNLLRSDQTPVEGVVSSTIIEKQGLRILVTGSSPDLGGFNEGLGIHVDDYKKALQRELEFHEGAYDVCIVLSHVGTEADAELAEAFEEVDVIISAHDHQLFDKARLENGTIHNSAGNYAEHVGVVEVEYKDGQLELIDSKMLPTNQAEPDQTIQSILATNKVKAIENLRQPLYDLYRPLWHDVIEENPLTNLIADGLKEMLDCDFGLINSGIVSAGLFDFVSKKKLIEVSPSPLNPTTFEVKGKDVKKALEDSLDAQVCLADGRGPGFRGKYAGRLHVSGATVSHDGERITEFTIDGQPVDDETWYTVGSSDYLHRGSGYPSLANSRNEKYRPEEIRDVIEMYAKDEAHVERAFEKRWSKEALAHQR